MFCKRGCGLVHASGTARFNYGTGVGLSQPGWRSSPLQLVWWNQVPEWVASSGSSHRPPIVHRGSVGFEVSGSRAALSENSRSGGPPSGVVVVVVLWSNTRQLLVAHDPARFVTAFRGEAR